MAKILLVLSGMIICYLLGSLNFAVIFSYIFVKKDVREYGSGNAGMTNVMRSIGVLPGILTFVFDLMKGVASVAIGQALAVSGWFGADGKDALLSVFIIYLSAFACQLGHIFPVFMGFKGGKAVATSLGILFMLDWHAAIIAFGTFVVVMAITRIVSISSILGTATAPFSILVFHFNHDTIAWQVLLCTVIAATIIIAHKQNIGRLIRGEEKKLQIKSKTGNNDK